MAQFICQERTALPGMDEPEAVANAQRSGQRCRAAFRCQLDIGLRVHFSGAGLVGNPARSMLDLDLAAIEEFLQTTRLEPGQPDAGWRTAGYHRNSRILPGRRLILFGWQGGAALLDSLSDIATDLQDLRGDLDILP